MRRLTLGLAAATLLGLSLTTPTAWADAITSGTLTDAQGHASGGFVGVFGVPSTGDGEWPLLGTATATPDGAFTVAGSNAEAAIRLARRNGGLVDWVALGVADDGSVGRSGATSRVKKLRGGGVRLIPAVARGGGRQLLAAAPTERIAMTTVTPRGDGAHAASCSPAEWKFYLQDGFRPSQKALQWENQPTIVGELHNAWNDGTRATFD